MRRFVRRLVAVLRGVFRRGVFRRRMFGRGVFRGCRMGFAVTGFRVRGRGVAVLFGHHPGDPEAPEKDGGDYAETRAIFHGILQGTGHFRCSRGTNARDPRKLVR
jgi:hypothetical protein